MLKSKEDSLFDNMDNLTAKAKKDIMDIYTTLVDKGPDVKISLNYGCILVFYMHLEGCIKGLSNLYIDFLKKHSNDIQLIPHLHYIIKNDKADNIKWIKKISIKKKEDKHNSSKLIDTLNNIDYETLTQILFILNIPENKYKLFEKDLNDFVKIRHDIAHGNTSIYHGNVKLTLGEIKHYKELVIKILTAFSQDIFEIVNNSDYKHTTTN